MSPSETIALHWNLEAETLEVDDGSENSDGSEDVGDVGEPTPPKGAALVIPSEK